MKRIILYQLIFTCLILCFFTCCKQEDSTTGDVEAGSEANHIVISREQADAIGLEFGKLQRILLPSLITSNGFLDAPPSGKVKISSIVPGKVVRINYLVGDFIRAGQEVIRLESLEFLEMQKTYLSVRSSLEYLEDNYQRQKRLSEENVNARKVFLQAQSEYLSAKAEYEYIINKLKILNANMEEINKGNILPYLSLRSSLSGYVTAIHGVTGEVVEADDILLEIISPEHLHAELNVYEKDLLKLKTGQKVEISTRVEDVHLTGEIFLIGHQVDQETRTVPVHVHIPEDLKLVPGMYVEGRILLEENPTLVIPEEGLVRQEDNSFVFALLEEKEDVIELRRHRVITGTVNNGMVTIHVPGGMDTTQMVAVKGVYYLSSRGE